MITEPTVLILGAGASQPYGFPVGSELKDTILNGLKNEVERNLYLSSGFTREQIDEFQDVLIASPYATIDAILSFRTSLAPIGKFAIIKTLTVSQQHERIFPPRDWYHYLFSRLALEDPTAEPPHLAVLTFNYDNSLEYFFDYITTRLFEGERREAIRKKFQSIPIVHLHGRLRAYAPPNAGLEQRLTTEHLQADIRVVSDSELDSVPEFRQAFDLLAKARRIAILGFGYDEINIRRLRINEIESAPTVFGTCLNLQPDAIKGRIKWAVTFCANHCRCEQALREWKELM